jgi:hypothetical protein
MILLCSSRLGTGTFETQQKWRSGVQFIPETKPPRRVRLKKTAVDLGLDFQCLLDRYSVAFLPRKSQKRALPFRLGRVPKAFSSGLSQLIPEIQTVSLNHHPQAEAS